MRAHRYRPRPSRRFRPRLEVLEDRRCPAVSISVLGGTLFVLGDNSANAADITDQGNGTVTARITGSTNSASRTAGNINSIVVLARDGADTVTYELANPLTAARALLIDLGRGSDVADLDAAAGVNSAYLLATVLGGDDADTITADVGAIAAGAAVGLALDGGRGGDTVSAAFAGLLNGTLALAVGGGPDNDTASADLDIASGSTGYLTAAVLGGLGDDDLTLNVNDDSGGGGPSTLEYLLAVLDGGPGTDACAVTDNVAVFNCEA